MREQNETACGNSIIRKKTPQLRERFILEYAGVVNLVAAAEHVLGVYGRV